jgi:homoserine kinase
MVKKKQITRPTPLHLALPATSANLGPAFDAAALAMDLHITIDARPAPEFSIRATGRDPQICQALENNLILTTYREILQERGAEIIPLFLRIKNEIPIGKGCGSSAAAREHHPDNAAACWMGGLAVARMSGEAEAQIACIRPKGKWPLLLAVPDRALATEEARGVLPAQYSRADVVANIQNSMLLLAAFMQGRRELLAPALEDRIHQPYRSPLCPLLPALREITGSPGILGSALSGAGPSVVVFLDPRSPVQKTKKIVAAHLASKKLRAELLLTSITLRGARDYQSRLR